MDFSQGIFISEWHVIVLFFTVIALFAMIVGRYPKKTIMISTILTFAITYVVVTGFVTMSEIDAQKRAEYVEEGLASMYEQNKGIPNDELTIFVGGFYDEDNDFTAKVYAKNFHEWAEFHGKVRVAIYDENRAVVRDEVLDVSLQPGESKEISAFFGYDEFEWTRYEFYPDR